MREENLVILCRKPVVYLAVLLVSVAIGFWLTQPGVIAWDDFFELRRSNWLLSQYHLAPPQETTTADKLYGPYWAFLLGVLDRYIFFSLEDSIWVWHAVNFALFPFGLFVLMACLIQAGVAPSTAFLSVSFLTGLIRFGGHALVNVKDFPHAMVFTIVSVGLFSFLRAKCQTAMQSTLRFREIISFMFLATLPYFFRTPLLIHYLGGLLFLVLFYFVSKKPISRSWLLKFTLGSFVLFLSWVVAVFPVIWVAGPRDWFKTFVNHGNSFADGPVRVAGEMFTSQTLPWWYIFPFFVKAVHPAVLFLGLLGLFFLFVRKPSSAINWLISTKFGVVNLSLVRWLSIITLGIGILFCLSPNIYDEERHFLFLFPMTFLIASLGFDFLPAKHKFRLGLVVIFLACVSYMQWGRFSYIYQNVLFAKPSLHHYMGDYWGVCQNFIVSDMRKFNLNTKYPVFVPEATEVLKLQMQRLQAKYGLDDIVITHEKPQSGSYYYLLINRINEGKFEQMKTENTLIWWKQAPTKEFACALFFIN